MCQASDHISIRVSQDGILPGRKAGCKKDTNLEALNNCIFKFRLNAVTILLINNVRKRKK